MFQGPLVTSSSSQAIALKYFLDVIVTKYLDKIYERMQAQGFTLSDGQLGNILYPENQLSADQLAALRDPSVNSHEEALELAAAFVKGGFYHLGNTVEENLPLVAECFESITHRPFIYIRPNFPVNGNRIFQGRNILDTTKAHYYNGLNASLGEYRDLQQDVASARWNQFSSENFKYHWSETLYNRTLGLFDIIHSNLLIFDWAQISNSMTDLRKVHQEYLSNLNTAYDTLQADIVAMEQVFRDAEENFQNIAVAGQNTFQTRVKVGTLQLLEGLVPSFTFSYPPDLSGHWGDADERELIRSQTLTYFEGIDTGFNSAVAMAHARDVYYRSLFDEVERETTVNEISEFISTILLNSLTYEAREFGNTVSEGDVLCEIADIYVSETEYDFYSLEGARTSCNLNELSDFDERKVNRLFHWL